MAMTRSEHYAEAERLLALVPNYGFGDLATQLLSLAHIHATLATATTAVEDEAIGMGE